MPETTDRVLAFAREAFETYLDNFLDDPFGALGEEEARDNGHIHVAELRLLAADLGINFEEAVLRLGTESERARLRRLEAGW